MAHIPQVGVMSTSLGALPRPVPRPLPWRYPSGFAGVSFATVLGLVVGWLVVVEGMDVEVVECVFHKSVQLGGRDWWPRSRSSCWPSSVSMELASVVFDVVGVVAGRGVGCPAGRGRCRWRVLRWCLTLCAYLLAENWVVEGVVAVRCRCRWVWLFVCSTSWLCSMAEVWVVVLAVVVVDGVFHKSVRCCGCVQWSWYGSW